MPNLLASLYKRPLIWLNTVILLLAVTAGAAFADAIDGQWCSSDGRSIIIEGDRVVSPGGAKLIGDYDRHHFIFTIPAGEQNGGKEVDMVLVNPGTVHTRYKAAGVEVDTGNPETWIRCKKPVS